MSTPVSFQQAVAGRYVVQRELGRGGMGIVYLAREVRLDRLVAIKLLSPPLAENDALRQRFLREARIAAQLSHPNIVPIHAVDEVNGFVFYAMTFVVGETLAQHIQRAGPLSAMHAARIMREIAWALAYAHQKGIVHRDIKPENLLLDLETRRTLVTDFGIALARAMPGSGPEDIAGTPAFMSPEQVACEPIDGRSDLYALGIVAYYGLSGELPFTGASAAALMSQHLTRPAPSIVEKVPATPDALDAAIARCLAKRPDDRYQSGEELADALGAVIDPRREVPLEVRSFIRAVPRRLIGLAVAIGVMIPTVLEAPHRVGLVLAVVALSAVGAMALELPRRVLRAGFAENDVAEAVRQALERRRDELAYQYGGPSRGLSRWTWPLSVWSVFLGALGLVHGLVMPAMESSSSRVLYGIMILAGAYGILLDRRRDLPAELAAWFWTRLPGRLVFRLARIGASSPKSTDGSAAV